MNLENRIKRRLLMEGVSLDERWHQQHIGEAFEPDSDADYHLPPGVVIRIAALEAEDSANPIAQTEQVRLPLRLNIDIAAFQAVYDDLDHE